MVTDKSNIELLENLMSNLNDPYAANELNDQIDLLFQMIDVWPKGLFIRAASLNFFLHFKSNNFPYRDGFSIA